MKKFRLVIYTPFGQYMDRPVDYIQVSSEDYTLGILPGHAPLVSTLIISPVIIKNDGNKNVYSIGGGIIRVENDTVSMIVESIESADEIDIERAKQSKQRAEERLKELTNGKPIDEKRARLSLARAINRIKLIEFNNKN